MPKSKKTTKTFKEIFLVQTILPRLHWDGRFMTFAYLWNGEKKWARLHPDKLIKAIRWDCKKP